MEGDDLGADEVVAGLQVGKGDIDDALVLVELVDGPYSAGQTVLLKLDPAALALGSSRGDPDDDGTVVGLGGC